MSRPSSSRFDPDFSEAARLVHASLTVTALRRATHATAALVEQSRIAAVVQSVRRDVRRFTLAARLRIAGVVLLAAAVTNAVLLLFLPRSMAPAPPFAMPAAAGIAAIVLLIKSSR
jgi:hypothetical protein